MHLTILTTCNIERINLCTHTLICVCVKIIDSLFHADKGKGQLPNLGELVTPYVQ
jgi:hypothetical protein